MEKTREQLEQDITLLGMTLANCRETLKLVNDKVYLPERVKLFVESSIREATHTLDTTEAISPSKEGETMP